MGKLKNVRSRRILWFARRRFIPAEAHARMKQRPKRPGLALALAVTVGLACAETEAVAPSEVPAPGSVNAPQKDTANVSVAVGATYVVETTSPYGPPFVVSGSGDPLIATVRGMTTDPGGVHSVEVTGVAEGSTTWDVVWDDYSTAPYSFGLSVSISVTAGSGTPPVAVPVERALVTVDATHTVDVGYQPTVSKTDGDDGLVTATPTTTGATFTGVAAGSATFRLEWTDGDAATQQRDVVITVTDGNVPTDTLELEIGGQISRR